MLHHVPFGVSESNVLASSFQTTWFRVLEKRQDTKGLFSYNYVSYRQCTEVVLCPFRGFWTVPGLETMASRKCRIDTCGRLNDCFVRLVCFGSVYDLCFRALHASACQSRLTALQLTFATWNWVLVLLCDLVINIAIFTYFGTTTHVKCG